VRQISMIVGPADVQHIAIVGDYIRVRAAAVPIRIESPDNNDFLILEVGDAVTLRHFERLLISHDSGSNQSITLIVGNGERVESTSSMKIIDKVNPVSQGPVTFSAFTANTTNSVVLPENLNRRFLMIQNRNPTIDIWVNFGAAAVLSGSVRIPAEGVLLLDSFVPTGAMNVISGSLNANCGLFEG
jgi:hypothetical protein